MGGLGLCLSRGLRPVTSPRSRSLLCPIFVGMPRNKSRHPFLLIIFSDVFTPRSVRQERKKKRKKEKRKKKLLNCCFEGGNGGLAKSVSSVDMALL